MVTKAQKLRVAVFFISGLLVISGFLFYGIKMKLGKEYDNYNIIFRDVSLHGLDKGSAVKYHGVLVGRVDRIEIDADDIKQIKVKVSIQPGVKIKEDSEVVVQLAGISGMKYIEITKGSNQSAALENGSTILGKGNVFDSLTGKVEVITVKFESVANHLNRFFQEIEYDKIKRITSNVEDITVEMNLLLRALNRDLPEINKNLSGLLVNLDESVKLTAERGNNMIDNIDIAVTNSDIPGIAKETRELLSRSSELLSKVEAQVDNKNVTKTILSVKDTFDSARKTIEQLDVTVSQGREDVVRSLRHLKDGLENFEEFTRLIKENPYLIFSSQDKEEKKFE